METENNSGASYEEYETLLLERDQAEKEAGQIRTAYMREFGQLITDVYEEKLECIKRKKTIAYYQNAINHGGIVDPEAMQKALDAEMSGYYTNLKKLIADRDNCRDAGVATNYDVQRSKTLYRRLAKLLHPDINPETDRQDSLKDLWERILTAYRQNDVKTLSELEVLAYRMLKELGLEGTSYPDIPDLEHRIHTVRKEIEAIRNTEPYTLRTLLTDEKAVEKKKKELEDELEAYRRYREGLDAVIQEMLQNGGIKLKWRMN